MMKILTDKPEWHATFSSIEGFNFDYLNKNMTITDIVKKHEDKHSDAILIFDYKLSLLLEKTITTNFPLLLPKRSAIQMEDKFFALAWLNNNGFGQNIPAHCSLDHFPFVLKTGNSTSGKNVFIIRSSEDLEKHNLSRAPFITQQYIPGQFEYAYHFISEKGEIIHQVCYQHDFSDCTNMNKGYIRGKRILNTKIKRIDLSNTHNNILHLIIKKLNYTGIGCFDLKIKDEQLKIIELNTRMGGSLIFYNHIMQDFPIFMKYYQSLLPKY
jgi:hypothetical protein